ncbi:fimbrial protein [Entomohabitans teleogrylli]|uniref:fimbrial protein n=1 Tax=Entomohabitans teleogrylli TaxID=1384589 RepID=UPI0008FCDCC2|nr:fimbrial protein [Entomohabitans teleogrylli]
MKKNYLSGIAMTLAMGCGGAMADGGDGVVNFTGSISDDTCTVATSAQTVNVELGTIATSNLSGSADRKAAPTSFKIALENCPSAINSANIKFDGKRDTDNSALLQLTNYGTNGVAEGVAVGIYDKSDNLIPLYSASSDYPLVAGNNELEFVARYVSTSNTVNPGSANATANFTLSYK